MSYSDDPISTIEDLDPEPPRRNTHLWELVLGLLLLLGVVGFAGWQWVHQTQLQNEYGAGTDAIARQDWEAAESHFQAASGYLDADKQAQQAANNIATRNRQYDAAVAADKLSNWPLALKAIQQVTRIESSYKDAARIEQRASEQIYHDAVSSTFALRPNADPPGLYYYGEHGWAWLPHSDQNSQIRSQSANDWIIYDIPGDESPSGAQPAQPPAQNGRPGPRTLSGRRLMAMPVGSPDKAVELALDPGQYSSFQAVSNGVWAARSGPGGSGNNPNSFLRGQRRFGPGQFALNTLPFPAEGATYESYTSSLTATLKLPEDIEGQNNLDILSFDPTGNRYLLAISPRTGSQPGAPLTGTTTLYLGQPGDQAQTLYSQANRNVSSGQFSPDGRFIIVHNFSMPTQAEGILLFDTQSNAPPRVLEESTGQLSVSLPSGASNNAGGAQGFNLINYGLSAAFIQDGPFAGKIVISDYNGAQTGLNIIDPANPTKPIDSLRVPVRNRITWAIYPGNSIMSLLIGQEIASGGSQVLGTLWVVSLIPEQQSLVTGLTMPADNFIDSARLTGDHITFSTYARSQNRSVVRSVFTLQTSALGYAYHAPPSTSTQVAPANNSGFGFFNLGDYGYGSALFAYVAGGDLHASPYDGSVDVTLETHVTYLYNPLLHSTSNNLLR